MNNFYTACLSKTSAVLTTERFEDIKTFQHAIIEGNLKNVSYLNLNNFFNLNNFTEKNKMKETNINKHIALAKAKGYKLNKQNLNNIKYILKCNNSYYNMAIIEKAYNIIKSNDLVEIYQDGTEKGNLYIKNNIGMLTICTFKINNKINTDNCFVFEIE